MNQFNICNNLPHSIKIRICYKRILYDKTELLSDTEYICVDSCFTNTVYLKNINNDIQLITIFLITSKKKYKYVFTSPRIRDKSEQNIILITSGPDDPDIRIDENLPSSKLYLISNSCHIIDNDTDIYKDISDCECCIF